jgi:hypothetical protein
MPYLCSGSPLQEAAACILLDLSVGHLVDWVVPNLIMVPKVEFIMEILTEFLPFVQSARKDRTKALSVVLFIQLVRNPMTWFSFGQGARRIF